MVSFVSLSNGGEKLVKKKAAGFMLHNDPFRDNNIRIDDDDSVSIGENLRLPKPKNGSEKSSLNGSIY